MGFLKTLLTGKEESDEEKKQNENRRNFDVFKYDGLSALNMGKVDYAEKCFEKALEITDDAEIRQAIARICLSKNDFDGAISNLEALCNLEPDTPGYHISLADVCIQAGKFDMADSECRKALQLSPDLAMPHYLLAEKANKQENYLEAVVQLTQAISLKDDYFEAYLLRGQVLCRMMQFGEAEKDADVLMQHNGDESEEVLRLKSCVCAHTGRESEAAELLEKAISLNPFEPEIYVGLSNIYLKLNDKDKALQTLEEGMEQNTDSPLLYRARGAVRLESGDKKGAMEDVKKALELAPEEEKNLSGKFSNIEEKFVEAYNQLNPYQFKIWI